MSMKTHGLKIWLGVGGNTNNQHCINTPAIFHSYSIDIPFWKNSVHIQNIIFAYSHLISMINSLPILDTLQQIKFFAGERRYSH